MVTENFIRSLSFLELTEAEERILMIQLDCLIRAEQKLENKSVRDYNAAVVIYGKLPEVRYYKLLASFSDTLAEIISKRA